MGNEKIRENQKKSTNLRNLNGIFRLKKSKMTEQYQENQVIWKSYMEYQENQISSFMEYISGELSYFFNIIDYKKYVIETKN